MAKPYELLRGELRPERRAANDARAAALLRTEELREAILAAETQLRHEPDVPTQSTALVDAYLRALGLALAEHGGELRLLACFPEGETEIAELTSFTKSNT